MANIVGHEVKIWKGSRASYDAIATKDNWVRYIVEETNGKIREFYGDKAIESHIEGDEF